MLRPPRVYLDTAFILDRADGTIDSALLHRLDGAIAARNAHSVVSLGHFWDVYASDSERDRARAIAVIGSMVNLRAVSVPPTQIEGPRLNAALRGDPMEEEALDLTLGPIDDLDGAMVDACAHFETLAWVGAEFARARNLGLTGTPKTIDPAMNTIFQRLIDGEEPKSILETMGLDERQIEAHEPSLRALRDTFGANPIFADALPLIRADMTSEGGSPGIYAQTMQRKRASPASFRWSSVRGGEQKWLELARRHAPGSYLSTRLSQTRDGDLGRKSKQSDEADTDHMIYLPYMDYATVDRENYGLIEQYLGELRPRPSVRLFKNGRLSDLVDSLESER